MDLVRSARNCVLIPLSRNTHANDRAIGASSDSSYRATINGVQAETSSVHRAPKAQFAQNKLVRSSFDRVLAWTAAEESPKSRSRSAMPITATTMATRPKSAGVSRRASRIRETNWRSAFRAWLPSTMLEPRAARSPRLGVRAGAPVMCLTRVAVAVQPHARSAGATSQIVPKDGRAPGHFEQTNSSSSGLTPKRAYFSERFTRSTLNPLRSSRAT